MNKRKDIPKTGSECALCGEGRVSLVHATLDYGEIDQEPYTSGIVEGDEGTIEFEEPITFVIYACDHCGHVYSILME